MLLPDLLIAHHLTGQTRYGDFYQKVVARFKDNPDRLREPGPFSLERLSKVNHSSEGQAYEALYNLIRYEKNPELLKLALEGLASSVEGFEESHPHLVQIVNSICNTLSNLGI